MKRVFVLIVSLLMWIQLGRSEIIILKDGTEIKGNIINENKKSIKVKTNFGDITIIKEKIKDVIKTEEKKESINKREQQKINKKGKEKVLSNKNKKNIKKISKNSLIGKMVRNIVKKRVRLNGYAQFLFEDNSVGGEGIAIDKDGYGFEGVINPMSWIEQRYRFYLTGKLDKNFYLGGSISLSKRNSIKRVGYTENSLYEIEKQMVVEEDKSLWDALNGSSADINEKTILLDDMYVKNTTVADKLGYSRELYLEFTPYTLKKYMQGLVWEKKVGEKFKFTLVGSRLNNSYDNYRDINDTIAEKDNNFSSYLVGGRGQFNIFRNKDINFNMGASYVSMFNNYGFIPVIDNPGKKSLYLKVQSDGGHNGSYYPVMLASDDSRLENYNVTSKVVLKDKNGNVLKTYIIKIMKTKGEGWELVNADDTLVVVNPVVETGGETGDIYDENNSIYRQPDESQLGSSDFYKGYLLYKFDLEGTGFSTEDVSTIEVQLALRYNYIIQVSLDNVMWSTVLRSKDIFGRNDLDDNDSGAGNNFSGIQYPKIVNININTSDFYTIAKRNIKSIDFNLFFYGINIKGEYAVNEGIHLKGYGKNEVGNAYWCNIENSKYNDILKAKIELFSIDKTYDTSISRSYIKPVDNEYYYTYVENSIDDNDNGILLRGKVIDYNTNKKIITLKLAIDEGRIKTIDYSKIIDSIIKIEHLRDATETTYKIFQVESQPDEKSILILHLGGFAELNNKVISKGDKAEIINCIPDRWERNVQCDYREDSYSQLNIYRDYLIDDFDEIYDFNNNNINDNYENDLSPDYLYKRGNKGVRIILHKYLYFGEKQDRLKSIGKAGILTKLDSLVNVMIFYQNIKNNYIPDRIIYKYSEGDKKPLINNIYSSTNPDDDNIVKVTNEKSEDEEKCKSLGLYVTYKGRFPKKIGWFEIMYWHRGVKDNIPDDIWVQRRFVNGYVRVANYIEDEFDGKDYLNYYNNSIETLRGIINITPVLVRYIKHLDSMIYYKIVKNEFKKVNNYDGKISENYKYGTEVTTTDLICDNRYKIFFNEIPYIKRSSIMKKMVLVPMFIYEKYNIKGNKNENNDTEIKKITYIIRFRYFFNRHALFNSDYLISNTVDKNNLNNYNEKKWAIGVTYRKGSFKVDIGYRYKQREYIYNNKLNWEVGQMHTEVFYSF